MSAFETPWKLSNEFRRYLALPMIYLYFSINGIKWGKNWKIFGRPLIQRHARSLIQIGDHFQMRNWFSSNPLGVSHRSILATWETGAKVEIGIRVSMTGATICAQESIVIGDHVRIGANSIIVDTDFHPIDPDYRISHPKDGRSRSVMIEDNVFIGMGSMILKGTRIGCGSVIGAGSVVSGEFPERVIVIGNPARIIREL